jgi:uncharacterized delta-60 repeat protein
MKKTVFFIFFLLLQAMNYAQTAASVDLTFPYLTLNNPVNCVAQQADGKIVIGGSFHSNGNLTQNRLTRLNADGTEDSSFNIGTGFNNGIVSTLVSVDVIYIQTDGKILVGGTFTNFNGPTNYGQLMRLNADGSRDTTFTLGTPFDDVSALAVQADGTIFVGGSYTGAGKLAKLNADGTVNATFGVDNDFNSAVRAIAVQADGKVLVGGAFTTHGGLTQKYIARFSTSGVKETFLANRFDSAILSIKVLSSGKIVVGGNFTQYNSTTQNKICRLNADGSLDGMFNIGTAFDARVEKIEVQSDGKFIIAGDFTTFNGSARSKITRLNSNGTLDNTFVVGTGFDGVSAVNTCLQTDGKILAVGDFTTYNGTFQERISRLNTDGTKDTSFNYQKGFDTQVMAMAKQADGKLLIGGAFTSFDGNITNSHLVRLNADGTKDTSFSIGTAFDFPIYSIAVQTNGKILVGGYFTTVNGTSCGRIVRLNTDGSIDSSFVTGTGFNNYVNKIVIQSDNKILVGGIFTAYNGASRNRIIRLNSDGSLDTSFVIGSGFSSGYINVIAVQSDNKILVGGTFTNYNGTSYNRIIRINSDGSADTSFTIGTGFDSDVDDIAIQTDGKILVGGFFTLYNGGGNPFLTRLNNDGTHDSTVNMGYGLDSRVSAITIQSDGKILAGGLFLTWDGPNDQPGLIRLNTDCSRDDSFNVGLGINGGVYSILIDSNNKIWVGGDFIDYNGSKSYNLVRLNPGVLSRASYEKNNLIAVFPNPAKEVLNIEFPTSFSTMLGYEVYDLLGKKVQEEQTSLKTINVSLLNSGIYLLKVKANEGDFVKKFSKE